MLNAYPAPNLSGFVNGRDNWYGAAGHPIDQRKDTISIDIYVTDRHRIAGGDDLESVAPRHLSDEAIREIVVQRREDAARTDPHGSAGAGRIPNRNRSGGNRRTPSYRAKMASFSIGAKTLSGFGYRGHVFWDTEIFMLPFFTYSAPEIARNLLEYRYARLEGARDKARQNGLEGAMFPWESADTGEEVTPTWIPDPADRRVEFIPVEK